MAISIRLDEETEKRLERLAQETGRTKTYYIRQALEEKLEELEDIYIALERLEKPGKRWTLEEVEQQFDEAQ